LVTWRVQEWCVACTGRAWSVFRRRHDWQSRAILRMGLSHAATWRRPRSSACT